MSSTQTKIYTEDDYYNLPEDVRAELIDGQIYYQAAPSRIHQRLLSDLHGTIYNYIKSNGGSCQPPLCLSKVTPHAYRNFRERQRYCETKSIFHTR